MMLDLLGYGAFFLTMALTYAIICLGLNVQWGQTGLFNVGVAGFVAIGAYASALLTTPDAPGRARRLRPADRRRLGRRRARRRARHLPRRRAHPPAARRLSRHRHLRRRRRGPALSSLNLEALTGGPFGIGFIPRPFAATAGDPTPLRRAQPRRPRSSSSRSSTSPSSGCSAAPGAGCCAPSARTRPPRRALGKNADRFRLQAFAIGGAIMGLAGAMQAHFIGFIAPENYLPTLTFQVWAMLIVGGSGNNRGAILGAVVVWGLWAVSARVVAALLPRRPAGPRRRAADRADRRRRSAPSCCCARAASSARCARSPATSPPQPEPERGPPMPNA